MSNNAGEDVHITATFNSPYDQIIEPFTENLSELNSAADSCSDKLNEYIGKIKSHIRDFFGCGDFDKNNVPYSENQNFFGNKSSSKVLLVELVGFEPTSKTTLPRALRV